MRGSAPWRGWQIRRYATSSSGGVKGGLIQELVRRGLIHHYSRHLPNHLDQAARKAYLGIDPTAPSIHLGNLLPIILLLHLQLHGHSAIFLVGGGTGAIGDPSGKNTARQALSEDVLARNIKSISSQLRNVCERGVEFAATRTARHGRSGSISFMNNADWLRDLSLLDFLSGPGKRARVATMLARESVKSRLNSSSGISFTEFTYQLLQAVDFAHLYKHKGCTVQIGGSDQWGNIASGIEMIRRDALSEDDSKPIPDESSEDSNALAYGLTLPLLTTSSGEKFGKSAGNAIWLDPAMTSPFELYQFLLKTSDEDVVKYLKLLTFLPLEEIQAVAARHKEMPEKREGQLLLASEVTELVHGASGLALAKNATQVSFGQSNLSTKSAKELLDVFSANEKYRLARSKLEDASVISLVVGSGLAPSNSRARQLMQGGGVSLNDRKVTDPGRKISIDDLIEGRVAILRVGKSNLRLIELEDE